MRHMGLTGWPRPNTAVRILIAMFILTCCGVSVVRPNQVWSIDITYIRLAMVLLPVAIMDWYSRRCWLADSNSMEQYSVLIA
jgi:putative transposase